MHACDGTGLLFPSFETRYSCLVVNVTQVKDPAATFSGVKTRTELLATRKYDRAHFYDRYDLDGDGVVRRRVAHRACFPGVDALCLQVDPYEVRLGALVDLDGNGEISQDEKDYLRDLIEAGKLKEISFLKDVRAWFCPRDAGPRFPPHAYFPRAEGWVQCKEGADVDWIARVEATTG
jgi:hypothetical protein